MAIQPLTHTRLDVPGMNPTPERPVRIVPRDLDAAELFAPHTHAWGQVTYALEGVVRATVGSRTWIIPPQRALWIAPNVLHEIETLERARLRILRVHEDAAPFQGDQCEVVDVSVLLRELIVALTLVDAEEPRESMLATLILDELARSATLPICVVLPEDKRLRTLCQMLITTPSTSLTLDDWATRVGASSRTLARLFERELGMNFGQWRQQVRLAHAAPLIVRGLPVSRVAAELGYTSQSAVSAMFRKSFGQSPTAFFARKEN